MISDRLFGLVMLFGATGYILAAQEAQSGFMSDPIGPNAFPTLVGGIAAICSLFMIFKPDPDPENVASFGWHVLGLILAMYCAVSYLVIEHSFPERFEHYHGTTVGFVFFVILLVAFLKVFPLAAAAFLLFGYALLLKPLGFLIPTIFAAGIISFQISGRPLAAALTGLGLSFGLFILFKFILDLGLVGISEQAGAYLPFVQPTLDIIGAGFDALGQFIPDFTPAEATTQSGGD